MYIILRSILQHRDQSITRHPVGCKYRCHLLAIQRCRHPYYQPRRQPAHLLVYAQIESQDVDENWIDSLGQSFCGSNGFMPISELQHSQIHTINLENTIMTLSYPIWLLTIVKITSPRNMRREKEVILQSPSALNDNWRPDIILRLDYTRISDLATYVLNNKIQDVPSTTKEFLGSKAKLTPKLNVKRLVISDAPSKEEVQVFAVLEGPLAEVGKKSGQESVKICLKTNAKVQNNNGAVESAHHQTRLFETN